MSQKKSQNELGPAGDQTTINSLSEITALDPKFRRFLYPDDSNIINENDTNNDTTRKNLTIRKDDTTINRTESNTIVESQVHKQQQQQPVKRGPTEISDLSKRQKKPLKASEEQLKEYRNENLHLKMQIYKLKHGKESISSTDLDDIRQDIVSVLEDRNRKLEEELRERDRKERLEEETKRDRLRDASCQTLLDKLNVEELLKDRIALKKLQHHQYQQTIYQNNHQHPPFNPNHHHHLQQQQQQATTYQLHNQQHHHHQDQKQFSRSQDNNLDNQQQQPQIMKQLHYPSVSIAKQTTVINNRSMLPDEKVLLEQIYRINGVMTTSRDILKTKLETQQ